MWEEVAEVVNPSMPGLDGLERIYEKTREGMLQVPVREPGAFRAALNESGWIEGEVLAGGMLRQGKPPTILGMLTGHAVIEVLRRRSKSLPREFCVAVTADRVVAIAMSPWKEGDEDTVYAVRLKPEKLGSWTRGTVRLLDVEKKTMSRGGTIALGAAEQFPVNWDGDPSTDELAEFLAG